MKSFISCGFRFYNRSSSAISAQLPYYLGLFLQGSQEGSHSGVVPRVKMNQLRFLTSVHDSNDRSNSISNEMNSNLMKAIKCNDVNKTLELFDIAKRETIIPQANVFTDALYLLYLNNQHEELDNLYIDMCNYGYHSEGGAKMIVIRSYVLRRMFKDALGVLDDIENNITMRHTRSYNPIIKGLAENGLTHQAFKLFHRKLTMSYAISAVGSENVLHDVEMFCAMIKSCYLIDSSQIPIYGNNQPFAKLDTRSMIKDKHLLVYKLFQFFYDFGMKF